MEAELSYKKLGYASYAEYLQSDHWRQFRLKILQKRKKCQKCGITKRLRVHHKNYGCLGKEQNADVIILCDDCHSRTHEKPKWRKRLRNNEELDFTGLSDKGRKRKYYNLGSSESRECKRCGEVHEIYYFLMKNGKMLLRMNCPNSNPRAMPIPFEPGLDIPVIQSRKK